MHPKIKELLDQDTLVRAETDKRDTLADAAAELSPFKPGDVIELNVATPVTQPHRRYVFVERVGRPIVALRDGGRYVKVLIVGRYLKSNGEVGKAREIVHVTLHDDDPVRLARVTGANSTWKLVEPQS